MSYIEANNKLDDIEIEANIISTKGLTKNLIDKYSITNGAKYFPSNGLQNCLVFISTRGIY